MTAHDVPPLLLPVLDLMEGHVVRGVAGERETYRSLQTPLATGTRPVDIACGLRSLVKHDWLYVADLDALRADAPQWPVLEELVTSGCRLIVDAGVRERLRAERLILAGAEQVVVALETLGRQESLAEIVASVGGARTLFSLDLKGGRPLGDPDVINNADPMAIADWAVSQGVGGVILLDLAGVGVGNGVPTIDLCRELRSAHPETSLISGGGVRHIADVRGLLAAGVDSVLVASAFHRRTITDEQIARLCG